MTTVLKGMTWNHTRGYVPLVACGQRFEELHPGIRVEWEKRSLKDFEVYPVEVLASQYDLIVIDHPFVGYAAKYGPLLALDDYLPPAFLADLEANSVGRSQQSYRYADKQWALAVDAAAPVAIWREDLMRKLGLTVPDTWDDLIAMARKGHVEITAGPIYCLMNFYSFCIAAGEEPFRTSERVVSLDVGMEAMDALSQLISVCPPACWKRNPIESHDLLASERNERIAYCPLTYAYTNYGRSGYADHRLKYGSPPLWKGNALRTTLGGTGLAVSAFSKNRQTAVAFAQYCTSGEIQTHVYTPAGGQPVHRQAWEDSLNNAQANHCYLDTMEVMERSFMRPRYCGYTRFQEEGGEILHAGLKGDAGQRETLEKLDCLYRETLDQGE